MILQRGALAFAGPLAAGAWGDRAAVRRGLGLRAICVALSAGLLALSFAASFAVFPLVVAGGCVVEHRAENEKGLADARPKSRLEKLVAGAGFEPTTFGL